jgi:hypothetical protein
VRRKRSLDGANLQHRAPEALERIEHAVDEGADARHCAGAEAADNRDSVATAAGVFVEYRTEPFIRGMQMLELLSALLEESTIGSREVR